MLMHVITNFTAHAGAEAMLSRLLCDEPPKASLVVPLIDVSDRYRAMTGPGVRYEPLRADGAVGLIGAVPRLARIIRRERPSAILCWMYHAMVAGTLAGALSNARAPVFWNVRQSLDDLEALSASTRAALRASRSLSRFARGIVFNSERSAELHKRFGFVNANIHVIPNGFYLAQGVPPQARRPSVFGIAARFHPQKDHRTFFRAAASVLRRQPHARFVAAGAGLETGNEAVQRLLAESGLPQGAITLCGEVEDMADFYRRIDVLVLSSRTEGFPNVIGEAMNHRRPVVTTDVGDAAAIVGDTGIVVPPGDPEALAEAMERMLALPPNLYAERAVAAHRRIAERYSLTGVAQQFAAFLGQA